jgi:regulator of sigma E protease
MPAPWSHALVSNSIYFVVLTLPAFVLAIALLIAVHEYGHFRMAIVCGVKVLRFSIGFGKPLYRWQSKLSGTEFVLAIFPLGGYVKMLDEREAPVEPGLRHLAFNTQALSRRVMIVVAGPLANLGLAVLLYTCVNWIGQDLAAPVLSRPETQTLASQAGVSGGERVVRAGVAGQEPLTVQSFDDLRWVLTQGGLEGADVELDMSLSRDVVHTTIIRLSGLPTSEVDAQWFAKVGIAGPFGRPMIGKILSGGAAQLAGLQDGDEVVSVNGEHVVDGAQLRQGIRKSTGSPTDAPQKWRIIRSGQEIELSVLPQLVLEGEQTIGRIGAYVGAQPEMVLVRYGAFDGVWHAAIKTWNVCTLTLQMMGKMLVGEASIKNISGPLTIADYAGKSAGLGLTQYLNFLALISVSLGVLNLLPLPVLDGGHLMYYLWEGVTGKPVAEVWLERLQRGGIAVLMFMMSVALFNDLSRLFAS